MSKLVVLAVAAATLCTTTLAHADDHADQAGPKDPTTALELSLGGTVASGALVAIGIGANNGALVGVGVLSSLVTPSLGEWYAGKPLTAGMGIRAASAVVFLAGVGEGLKCLGVDNCQNNDGATSALLLSGLAGYAAGTIYDIALAPSAARDFNAEHHLHIAPTYMRTPSGNATMGVGIGGTF